MRAGIRSTMVAALGLSLGASGGAFAGEVAWPDLEGPPAGVDRGDTKGDAALIVGIEDYTFLPDVPGAAANALAWERWLLSQGMPAPRVQLLVDQSASAASGALQATRENILRGARRAAAAVQPGGRLWVVFVGHGASSSSSDVLLLGTDTTRTVDGFRARGIPRGELMAALASPAVLTVAVLDACFSGEATGGGALLNEPLQPALLTRLAEHEGVIELLATSADQFAGPLPGGTRPAFSYLVLGALRGWGDQADGASVDGAITAGEALQYAEETLTMMVTGRSQVPTSLAGSPELLERPLAKGRERGPDRAALRRELLTSGGSAAPVTTASVASVPAAQAPLREGEGRVCAFRRRGEYDPSYLTLGIGGPVGIWEDGDLIVKLGRGEVHCWNTFAGSHTFTGAKGKRRSVFEVLAGETTYIQAEQVPGVVTPLNRLSGSDEASMSDTKKPLEEVPGAARKR